jgi:hypothetical protein
VLPDNVVALHQFEAVYRAAQLDAEHRRANQVPQQRPEVRAGHKAAFLHAVRVRADYSRLQIEDAGLFEQSAEIRHLAGE